MSEAMFPLHVLGEDAPWSGSIARSNAEHAAMRERMASGAAAADAASRMSW